VLAVSSGCKKPQSEPRTEAKVAEPAPTLTTHSAELAAHGPSARVIESLNVPNDRKVLVVIGANKTRPIIHLHGMCAEARSDLEAFGSTVTEHGTVIALEGDVRCSTSQRGASWSNDVATIDERIDAAIQAVNATRGTTLDPGEVILVGESMGAARVAALAARFPSKYTRLVLVGSPETPSAKDLRGARGIALLAGEKEPQERMRQGALGLENAGLNARFWEMEGATHGSYGSDGHRAMEEAVAFVAAK
jgi:pimeloyl-ACP methyl ester carboxylesterase